MSNKQIEKHDCEECESEFKIVFELDKSSGYPKFCPFCAAPFTDEEEDDYWNDDKDD